MSPTCETLFLIHSTEAEIYRLLSANLRRGYVESGQAAISQTAVVFLQLLMANGGMLEIGKLAELTQVTRPHVTNACNELQRLRLVERRAYRRDGRFKTIVLTKRGYEYSKIAKAAQTRIEERLSQAVKPENLQSLLENLQQLRDQISLLVGQKATDSTGN